MPTTAAGKRACILRALGRRRDQGEFLCEISTPAGRALRPIKRAHQRLEFILAGVAGETKNRHGNVAPVVIGYRPLLNPPVAVKAHSTAKIGPLLRSRK